LRERNRRYAAEREYQDRDPSQACFEIHQGPPRIGDMLWDRSRVSSETRNVFF
jgi:hypothetical protein